ncbi:MAG: response regulator [Lentisphaerae bacterium]|nr:response regulator [Lentisphaerota bacterium]
MTDSEPNKAARLNLGARIDALDAAIQGLSSHDSDAESTLRALAASTVEQAANHPAWSAVRESADRLAKAEPPQLAASAQNLIGRLREAASSQRLEPAIVLVGGEPDFFAQLGDALSHVGRPLLHAPTGAEARHLLKERSAICIVLHVVLPDLDGRILLSRLRELPITASIPVLLLAERIDESLKEESLLHAADGYLEHTRDCAAIVQWVSGRLRRAPEAARAARRDALTGLLNRAALREAFERVQKECADRNDPLSLATISVDNSRALLHRFDTDTREDLLQTFGVLLSSSLRSTDIVARWGLYEFTALFPGEDHTGGTRAVEKVIEKLRDQTFETAGGETVRLSIAAGVVAVQPTDALDDVIAQADHFVYQATAKGGNVVVSEQAPAPARRQPRVSLLVRDSVTTQVLRQLLEKDSFDVTCLEQWDDNVAAEFARHRPHLVIIDERFPPAGGIEILKTLRQDPQNSRLPIIMLVAGNSENAVSQALAHGANDYIVRPFSPFSFVSRTHRLLSRGAVPGGDLCRILIVSDEAPPLVLLGSGLHQRGEFEVLLARGGKQGLARLQAEAPDVLLVDTPIGPVDGKPFWEALTEQVAGTPLTVVVAEASSHAKPPTYPIPVRGHIKKPFSPLKVGSELENLLGLTPSPRRSEEANQHLNAEIRQVMKKDR